MVRTARWAASLDTIETALASGAVRRAVLVTDDPTLRPGIPGVEMDIDEGPFHLGRRLAGVLKACQLESVIYLGGGSLPLLSAEDFASIAQALAESAAVTNNAFSSDLVAFPAADQALRTVEQVEGDNSLARALSEQAGLALRELPRSLETLFDIDTPADIGVLTVTGLGGSRLRAYVDSLDLNVERHRRVLPLFLERTAELLVAGRVGTHAWQYLERETACRVRLFAEERGMQADGRAAAGQARSLLGFHLQETGPERFFRHLSELAGAAFIDTRVILAHVRSSAGREDRFLSDLGRWQEISDPLLREFTGAAMEAPIPVLLGGHSLMSGGLMALNEHAWRQRDAGIL
jgi:2-phospho-L-lactate guanylyltransferase (CobY/MobA/RfbA family)